MMITSNAHAYTDDTHSYYKQVVIEHSTYILPYCLIYHWTLYIASYMFISTKTIVKKLATVTTCKHIIHISRYVKSIRHTIVQ